MKRRIFAFGITLALAACGGTQTAVKEGENTTDSDAAATEEPTAGGEGDGGAAAEKGPAQSPCASFDADLTKLLLQTACEVPTKPNDKPRELKGVLEVKVAAVPTKVAPGGHVDLVLTFVNKGKSPLPLDFTVNPEPHFSIELYDSKGDRADLPPGDEPSLPDSLATASPSEKRTGRAVLVQGGSGQVKLTWDAVKRKWAPKDKVKGALPGHGYPTIAGSPLPKGKYSLKVITPLVGVFEGIDREMSQPRVQIEVGN